MNATQPSLFGIPHSGSPTSHAAADSMRPTAQTLREKVFEYIRCQGDYGATEEEIEYELDLTGNTCRPRVWELMKAERIEDSGAMRKTRSGRYARVLRVTP